MRRWIGSLVLGSVVGGCVGGASAARAGSPAAGILTPAFSTGTVAFAVADEHPAPRLSDPARAIAAKVLALADHQGLPFAVVDKLGAQLAVFHPDGRLAGISTALLGQARGDDSSPGVGLRTQSGQLRPDDRTTPAGRFVSMPGRNQKGEAVVWVDFEAAFAIHRLRADAAEPSRAARMASSNPRDKRVSSGCVVVPVAFYQQVVQAVLGRGPAVVYVMPESRPWQTVFAARSAHAGF